MSVALRCLGLVLLLIGCIEPATDGPVPPRPDRPAAPRADATPPDAAELDAAADRGVDAGPTGCEGCHRGIEAMHPEPPLTCVDCHGGDPAGITVEAAHAPLPPALSSAIIKRLDTDQLDALDPAALRFVNPGDLRVATTGCGSGNAQAGGAGCHQPIVEAAQRSVMQTYVGHYTLPRFLAGVQDRAGIHAAVDVVDPAFDPAIPGTVPALTALRTPETPMAPTAAAVLDRYLPQQCPYCHTASFGRNDAPRNYRSSGCSACHVRYADDGLPRGADPTLDPTRPPRAITHELTTAPPTQQCERCHFQGARIGLSFQGIREGGFAEQPPRAVPLAESAHGHGPGFYLLDEDEAAPGDETPPDIHFERGMHCVDCHTAVELHGDGRLHSTAKGQLDVTCTDCHGTVRARITPGDDGRFRTAARGSVLRHLEQDAEGRIWLIGKTDGARHPVKQIADVLAERPDEPGLQAAMGVRADGTSHTDTMECWTCHTAWRPNCFGCHVTLDERFTGRDHQSGLDVVGEASGARVFQALDFLALGVNGRGRIDTLCPSMQILFEWIDESGATRMRDRSRVTAAGQRGYGWMPTFAHTVRPAARPCTQCHPDDLDSNTARVRETYGFGNPARGFELTDDAGVTHDLTQARAADGAPLVAFPHVDSGLIPMDRVERALAVRIPTGQERCNGADDDGDGAIDEGIRLRSDPNNCGACGVVCPGPAPVCSIRRCLTRAWVSPDGDDAADGSRARPWRSLAHAVAQRPETARRLLLLPGLHRLDAPLDVPPQVEIEGAGLSRDDVIIDGRLRFADAPAGVDRVASLVSRVTLTEAIEVRRQILEVFDVRFAAPAGHPAMLDATEASVGVIQCSVEGARAPLVRADASLVRILRSRLIDAHADAALITARNGGRLVLSNDVVQGVSGPVIATDAGSALNLTLTTLVGVDGPAVRLGDAAGQSIIANAIFADLAAPVEGAGAALVASTNLLFETAPWAHPGAIVADPRFVDRAGGDLRLAAGSPALDRADPTFITDTDIDQIERPQGPGVDLGAHERRAP